MEKFNFFYAKRDCPQLCKTCRLRFECSTRAVNRLGDIISLGCEYEKLRKEYNHQVAELDSDEIDNIPLVKYAKFYKWSKDVLEKTCNRVLIGIGTIPKVFVTRLNMILCDTCDMVYTLGEKQWHEICASRKSILDELKANGTIRP